jgi:hypothetical protein
MRYAKLYDAMLATPIQPYDIARGDHLGAATRRVLLGGAHRDHGGDGPRAVVVDAAGAARDHADRVRVRRRRPPTTRA